MGQNIYDVWENVGEFSQTRTVAKLKGKPFWFVIDAKGNAFYPGIPTKKSDGFCRDGSIAFPGEGKICSLEIGKFEDGCAVVVAERLPYEATLFGEQVPTKKYYGVVSLGGYTFDFGELPQEDQPVSELPKVKQIRETYRSPKLFERYTAKDFKTSDNLLACLDILQFSLKLKLAVAEYRYSQNKDLETFKSIMDEVEKLSALVQNKTIELCRTSIKDNASIKTLENRISAFENAKFSSEHQTPIPERDISFIKNNTYKPYYSTIGLKIIDGRLYVYHYNGKPYVNDPDAIVSKNTDEVYIPVRDLPGKGRVDAIDFTDFSSGVSSVAMIRSKWDEENKLDPNNINPCMIDFISDPEVFPNLCSGIITPNGYFIDDGVFEKSEYEGILSIGSRGNALVEMIASDPNSMALILDIVEDFDEMQALIDISQNTYLSEAFNAGLRSDSGEKVTTYDQSVVSLVYKKDMKNILTKHAEAQARISGQDKSTFYSNIPDFPPNVANIK